MGVKMSTYEIPHLLSDPVELNADFRELAAVPVDQ